MIAPADIMAALRAALEGAFPGEPVYADVTPRNFDRPSNMVELTSMTLDALSMGRAAVGIQYQYKITTFCTVDEVHDSHLPALDLRAMLILGAFADGCLRVKDRAPKVVDCVANTSFYDCAEVALTLALTLDRSEFEPAEIHEIMRELETNLQTRETTS